MRLNVRVFLAHAAVLVPVLLAAGLMGVSRPTMTGLALIALMVSLLVSFVVARLLGQTLNELTRAAHEVGSGRYYSLHLSDMPGDIAGLIEVFNRMVESLRERDAEFHVLNNELSRRVRELNALYEVSRSVNSSLDVQVVLRTILNETVRTFPSARKAIIHLVDTSGERLVPYALSNTMRRPNPSMGLPIGKGIAGYAVRKRRSVTIPDTSKDPRFLDLGSSVRSLMVTPLEIGESVIGALSLDSDRRNAFTPDMEVVLRSLGNRAAMALENARLFSESQKRVAELTALYHSALDLSGEQRDTPLHERLVTLVTELLATDAVVLFLVEPTRGTLVVAASTEVTRSALRRYRQLAERVLHDREPRIVNPAVTRPDSLTPVAAQGGTEPSLLGVPLIWEHQVLGVLQTERDETRPPFEAADARLLTLFAQLAASHLENVRLIRVLKSKTAELEAANRDLARASRLKSEFLANMSHELRTPLNSILGFSEILMDQTFAEIGERPTRYVANINRSGQHLLDLINDILDLSRIEAGRMELSLERFRVRDALHEVQTLIEPLLNRKTLTLEVDSEAAPEWIVADRLRLKQVLYNLLSNAVKFTPEGGQIRLRSWQPEPTTLFLSVHDTGVGIPDDQLEQIFDVFHRIDHAFRRETEGTGLGLALVRHFVKLHGGKVWVQSTEGIGSTFTLSLPQHPPQMPPLDPSWVETAPRSLHLDPVGKEERR